MDTDMRRYKNEDFMDTTFLFRALLSPVEHDIAPHTHEFIEFVYVSEGRGEHVYRGNVYSIYEGDVFIIEPHVEHGYRLLPGVPLIVNNIIFDPVFFQPELEVMARVTPFVDFFYVEPFLRILTDFRSHLNLNPLERLEMKQLLDRLTREDKERELGFETFVRTTLIQLFVTLSRCYERWIHKPLSMVGSERKMFQQVREFIELHYDKPISLAQLSQLCGMSQSTFTTKFKQHSGLTFLEFRNEFRMKTAKEMLATTEDKIVSIAMDVGFEDLSFFNKTFKQHVGVSPGKYRAEIKRERGLS